MLKTIFGNKGCELTGEWGRLQSYDPYDLCLSRNTFRKTKSRKMTWAGNVARIGVTRGAAGILVGRFEGRRPL